MIRTQLRRPRLPLTALCAVAAAFCGSCGSHSAEAAAPPKPASVLQKHEPTPEHLVERSKARWNLIAQKNWIEAYAFSAPEIQKNVSLAQYLAGKNTHEYTDPKVGEVLRIQKDQGYVRVTVAWTPHHPDLQKVKLEPGQSLTETIDMIETWHFTDGDWSYVKAQNEEDFFHAHADLLKNTETAGTATPAATPK